MKDASYPFFLQWHLTERCNLRCRHCYQQSPVEEMLYEEIGRAIDKFAGVIRYWAAHYQVEVSPSIHFTGGEPFLRDDLFDLLRHARRTDFQVSVLSNGTLITRDIARQVCEAEVHDIQVSLDGMEEVNISI